MRFRFGFGKRFGADRLSPEQSDVLDRFERGELTAEEAEALLGPGARARSFGARLGSTPEGDAPSGAADEDEDEARSRELVALIAREVDEETRR